MTTLQNVQPLYLGFNAGLSELQLWGRFLGLILSQVGQKVHVQFTHIVEALAKSV